ncbi:MAG: hypothetical protein EXQ67_00630 [Thermoleophilia bacterium]|nr:hypothetical protein [Thermoleophilia bacterium]
MTYTRITKIVALLLMALVATTGVADAKQKKKKKKRPAAAVVLAPAVRSWVSSSIVTVLSTGAFPGVTRDTIAPDDALDGPSLAAFVAVAFPNNAKKVRQIAAGQTVTMGDVDAAFVSAAGLDATAVRAEELITAAGYVARPGVGYEIVARLLRLRTNLDQADDSKEHAWYEQASRGDAIWSTAQVLKWGGWEKQGAIDTVELLATLPVTAGPQHDAVQRAFDFIGMPYIWGGTSEKPQILFGFNTAGGFDCSGFLWRVLALDPTSPTTVAKALGGRTTYEMAGKTPAAQRLTAEQMLPGDVMLFGRGGVNAPSGSIGHTGMTISPQLFIQSSGQGIALARWDTGYYKDNFAFGKRVLG